MSNLIHAQGNLLDMAEAGEFNIVVQGCNCFNAMGGGIAREIRDRYPLAAEVDNLTQKGDYNKLGNYTVMLGKRFNIVNAYTQYNMSTGEDVFEYTAFKLILQKMAKQYPICAFGFPYIGMGLARGNAARITTMLTDFADTITQQGGTVTLVEFA